MTHWLGLLLTFLFVPQLGIALEPKQVFVIANKEMPESIEVAEHYLKVRQVPKENVIALSLPKTEDISRTDFEAQLREPLRKALENRKGEIQVLLTVYGVPLRVGSKVPSEEDKAAIAKIDLELIEVKKTGDKAKEAELENRKLILRGDQSTAAVDSELMLLWWPKVEPTRWVFNPSYWQVPEEQRKKAPPMLLTARLDGPTPTIAKRLVDDAIAAEKNGLVGKAYFDARGIAFDAQKAGESGTGYEGYDESYREVAAMFKDSKLSVTLDNKPELFASQSCPDAALYSGWYSVGNYKDCCTFAPGAIAWHLASFEAVTLRDPKTKQWCVNLLQDGVAATLGPVAEPYTVGFPKPAEFFGFLATGKYTLCEVFARTTILTSWMMVLVGDPLYNPFAKNPLLKVEDVLSSPKGVKMFK